MQLSNFLNFLMKTRIMKQGFTLIELSVVLVIIGLIVGGISVGQDMLRHAEVMNVMADVHKFQSAVETFEKKYQTLPGDFSTASTYWSSCIDNGANLCDGNGNGMITEASENIRFWQHLSLAKLIEGRYDGGQLVGSTNDTMYPKTPMGNYWNADLDVDANNRESTVVSFPISQLTPEEAMALDEKYDDGYAPYNLIFSNGYEETCTSGFVTSPDNYDVSAEVFAGDCAESHIRFMITP